MDIWSKYHGQRIKITYKDGTIEEGWACICINDIFLYDEQYNCTFGVPCPFEDICKIEVLDTSTDMSRFDRKNED